MNYKNRFLALLLITSILVPVLPMTTEAQFGVPTVDQGLNTKEVGLTVFGVVIPGLTLDLIAITIARTFIENILNSTIDWINSGFEGNPAYVSDPEKYLGDIADGIAGEFIAGSDLNFLCSPFQAQIRFSLLNQYRPTRQFQCTLSEVVDNIEGFYDDFSQGGWDGWFSMTQHSSNNPYGAYIQAQIELDNRVAQALGITKDQLSWDSGFIGWSPCEKKDDETGECTKRGPVQTPGVVIESQLESVLGTGVRQLELADEFDELVSALVVQLLQKFVFGSSGLLSGGGGGGGGGYNGVNLTQPPTVSLSANPIIVAPGGSTSLTWSASNSTGCTASGGWTGQVGLNGTRSAGPISSDQVFTITCSNGRENVSRSVTVTSVGGTSGSNPLAPTLTFTANPPSVPLAGESILTWFSTNATSCTASGGWTGSKAVSGSQSTGSILIAQTFTLTCSNATEQVSKSVSVTLNP